MSLLRGHKHSSLPKAQAKFSPIHTSKVFIIRKREIYSFPFQAITVLWNVPETFLDLYYVYSFSSLWFNLQSFLKFFISIYKGLMLENLCDC